MLEIDPLELPGRLRASLDIPRWVEQVMNFEPFSSLEDLLSTAHTAAEFVGLCIKRCFRPDALNEVSAGKVP
jgi:hypothetical protein